MIQSTLGLNDSSATTTFSIASGATLDIAGQMIDGATSGQQITLSGGGTLQIDNANNTFSGGTTVQNGTLQISSTGTLGSGPLTFNPVQSTDSAIVTVQNSIQINNLSQSAEGGGSAQLNIAPSMNVTLNQTASASFGGVVSLGAGSTLAVQQNSANVLTIGAAPSFGKSSTLAIKSGTVAFNTNAANATISGTGAQATVAAGATLQLTGSALALSSGSNSASVANDGTFQIVGVSNQTVGAVASLSPPTTDADGAEVYTGDTIVGDGTNNASLVASQILQNSLTINAGSTVTILPSSGGSNDVNSATSANSAAVGSASVPSVSSSLGTAASDPLEAIQDAESSGAISTMLATVLEDRLAAIERLAATDPQLNVSLLENRVLALLPANVDLLSINDPPASTANADSITADGVDPSAATNLAVPFDGATTLSVAPPHLVAAAVPEPASLLLAAVGALGLMLIALRRNLCY